MELAGRVPAVPLGAHVEILDSDSIFQASRGWGAEGCRKGGLELEHGAGGGGWSLGLKQAKEFSLTWRTDSGCSLFPPTVKFSAGT